MPKSCTSGMLPLDSGIAPRLLCECPSCSDSTSMRSTWGALEQLIPKRLPPEFVRDLWIILKHHDGDLLAWIPHHPIVCSRVGID